MATSPLPTPKSTSEKTTKASLGAFAFSVLIHSAAILIVGGYVIFEGVVPKASFIPVEESGASLEGDVIPEPEQPTDPIDTPTMPETELTVSSTQSSETDATSSDILVSTGANPTFSLPPAVGAPSTTPKLGFGTGTQGNSGNKAAGPKGNVIRSIFGSTESSPSTLRGTMFDLKQSRSGEPIKTTYLDKMAEYCKKQDTDVFKDFYKVDTVLYATHLFVPLIVATEAPKAFQVEDKVKPAQWVIVYEGQFTAPSSGSYRFVGYADDILVVFVNGKVVLDGSRPTLGYGGGTSFSGWTPGPETTRSHRITNGHIAYGDWLKLDSGRPNKISILFGEQPGGQFCGFLFIQEEGKKYDKDATGRPVLPVFRLQDVKIEVPDGTQPKNTHPFEPKGPVFRNP